jgi:hypothetical protein
MITEVWWGNRKGKNMWGNFSVNGRGALKCIIKEKSRI